MPLPDDWKTRIEKWWSMQGRYPNCVICSEWTGNRWELMEWTSDPQTVALVCPQCGYAHVFLWSKLDKFLT
jgi:hypothetical protein